MLARLAELPVLFAQDGPTGGIWQLLITFLPLVVIFYVFLILPQQQQEKKRRAAIESLKKNDKVVTSAGIYGTVVSVDAKNDKLVLRVDDERGIRMTFTRSSVGRVIESSADKPADAS